MAYSDLDVEVTYTGDNVTTTFPINFARETDFQVKVKLYNVIDPDNPVQIPFVEGVDYNIVGDEIETTSPLVDDTITPVPANTTIHNLFVYRETVPTHATNYTEYEFPYETMNVDLDTVYQIAQENRRRLETTAITNDYFESIANVGQPVTVADIVQNTEDIATNASDIAANAAAIAGTSSSIATNASNIATNASGIATNASSISTNTSGIATNASNIATNASSITTLSSAISGISTPTMYNIVAAETYAASAGDIVIVDTNDIVQVTLPAAAAASLVRIKVSEKTPSNKTVVAAEGIDGFGTTYTLSSEYESVSLVSDGTKWYII